MIRTLFALGAVLAAGTGALAQVTVRTPAVGPQPAGVIPTPGLPFAGAPGVPSPVAIRTRPFVVANPAYDAWALAPVWPAWYYSDPWVFNTFSPPAFTLPPPAPAAAAVDTRARLTLNIPAGARVWLAGQEVDTAERPVVLESPPLMPGEFYAFDVRVAWTDRSRKPEERNRIVRVEAGDRKSLTYLATR